MTYGPPHDWEALAAVLCQAFHIPADRWSLYRRRLGDDAFRVVRDDAGGVPAGLALFRCGQYFGGRVVPMTGLAAVGVAPEARGAGVGQRLVDHALREAYDEGVAVSTLYPATRRTYRRSGYEVAGACFEWAVDLAGIALREHAVEARPSKDTSVLLPLHVEAMRRSNGGIERNPAMWERLVTWYDAEVHGSVVPGEGYVLWYTVEGERKAQRLVVREFVALTARAARRLWTVLADHRSVADEVRIYGPAVDPLLAALPEVGGRLVSHDFWMTRIVDVPRALGARGYAVDGVLDLEVEDPLLPNSGRWHLEVRDGVATVERGGTGALRMPISNLAPLYTGHLTAGTLAHMGWIEGDAEALRMATALFAGPQPWMCDRF